VIPPLDWLTILFAVTTFFTLLSTLYGNWQLSRIDPEAVPAFEKKYRAVKLLSAPMIRSMTPEHLHYVRWKSFATATFIISLAGSAVSLWSFTYERLPEGFRLVAWAILLGTFPLIVAGTYAVQRLLTFARWIRCLVF